MSNISYMGKDYSWVADVAGPAANFLTDVIGGKPKPPPPPPNPLAELPWGFIAAMAGGLVLVVIIASIPKRSPAQSYNYVPSPSRRQAAPRRKRVPKRRKR